MNVRALRAFVELVKHRSFTSAADALFVTQPTISKLIKQLESELELTLLERSGHQFELTPAGQLIYNQGADILQRMRILDASVRDFQAHETGILKLGLPPTVGEFFFCEILMHFQQQYPHIQIQLFEEGSEPIVAMALSGQIDVGIAMLPVSNALATRPFIYDDLYFISRKPSIWDCFEEVTLGDIAEAEFVLFAEGYSLSKRLESAFVLRQQTLKVGTRSAQWQFIRALVQASSRCTVMPETIANKFDDAIFHKARILDSEQYWHLALLWKEDTVLSRPAKLWLETCEKYLPTIDSDA